MQARWYAHRTGIGRYQKQSGKLTGATLVPMLCVGTDRHTAEWKPFKLQPSKIKLLKCPPSVGNGISLISCYHNAYVQDETILANTMRLAEALEEDPLSSRQKGALLTQEGILDFITLK